MVCTRSPKHTGWYVMSQTVWQNRMSRGEPGRLLGCVPVLTEQWRRYIWLYKDLTRYYALKSYIVWDSTSILFSNCCKKFSIRLYIFLFIAPKLCQLWIYIYRKKMWAKGKLRSTCRFVSLFKHITSLNVRKLRFKEYTYHKYNFWSLEFISQVLYNLLSTKFY